MSSLEAISAFLGNSRFAAIGVSRNPKDFTRMVVDEFEKRGYEVVRVNPRADGGGPMWRHSIAEVSPPVKAALLFTPPAETDKVVRDCAAAGVQQIWMHRGGGQGAVSRPAVEFCREHQIAVIPGECPYMFLPGRGGIHSVHAFIRKLCGKYPH